MAECYQSILILLHPELCQRNVPWIKFIMWEVSEGHLWFDRTFFYKPTFDFPKSTFVIIHSILSLYVIFGWVIKPANHWFSFLLIETKCRRCFDKRNMGTFAFNTALLALYNVIMLMCQHLIFKIHLDIFQVCLSILLSQANYLKWKDYESLFVQSVFSFIKVNVLCRVSELWRLLWAK